MRVTENASEQPNDEQDDRLASVRKQELAAKERRFAEEERQRAAQGGRSAPFHARAAHMREMAAALYDGMADMNDACGC